MSCWEMSSFPNVGFKTYCKEGIEHNIQTATDILMYLYTSKSFGVLHPTHHNVLQGLVNDFVVVRQAIKLVRFKIEKDVVTILHTVRVSVRFEPST